MTLSDWHKWRKDSPRDLTMTKLGCADVTVITYIYGGANYVDNHFYQIENAIRETWFHLGFLKAIIVTSDLTPTLEDFGLRFKNWVRIDICNNLVGGDLYAYSRDCIQHLHERFTSPYTLFIHPDGFPLRSGIEEFIGKYDYIGAPWPENKDDWIGKIFLSQENFVGNGGFSLRSHAICEAAAYWYNQGFKFIPNIFLMHEDYFFTRVLPKYVASYKNKFRFATVAEAEIFAQEQILSLGEQLPLGFHSAKAFEKISFMPQFKLDHL